MAELPGWDRDRLALAPERDVEAARLFVYARERAPEVRRDIKGDIERIQRMGRAPNKAQDAMDRMHAIRELTEAQGHQDDLRRALDLDGPDELEDAG